MSSDNLQMDHGRMKGEISCTSYLCSSFWVMYLVVQLEFGPRFAVQRNFHILSNKRTLQIDTDLSTPKSSKWCFSFRFFDNDVLYMIKTTMIIAKE